MDLSKIDFERAKFLTACADKFIPKTDDELYEYIKRVLNIDIPRTNVCPYHDAPFQVLADAYFCRHPVICLTGARGCGKTVMLATLALVEQITKKAFITLVAASEEQSNRVLELIRAEVSIMYGKFHDSPMFPKSALVQKSEESRLRSKFTTGGEIRALSASPKALRGLHPALLRYDESDEMEWEAFKAALGQPRPVLKKDANGRDIPGEIAIPTNILICSTHHLPNGTMTKIKQMGKEQNPPWSFRGYCYKEVMVNNGGWVTDEMVADWRAMTPPDMWEVEYELGAPSVDLRIWDPAKVHMAFDRSLGEYDGKPNECIKIEDPDPCYNYYHGVDWAKEIDWTVISTFRKCESGPDVLVHWERMGRRSWRDMVERFNEIVKRYPGAAAFDDTGAGSVIRDFLTVSATPINFSARKQIHDMLRAYQTAIENGELKFPYIKWLKEQHEYAAYGDLFGIGAQGHLPDGIASAALAWYSRRKGLGEINIFRI